MQIIKRQRHRLGLQLAMLAGCTLCLLGVGCGAHEDVDEVVAHSDAPRLYGPGTAFAYGYDATCFTDLGFTQWGWTIPLTSEFLNPLPVYANVTGCVPNPAIGNGTLVGWVTFHNLSTNDELVVDFQALPGFGVEEEYVWGSRNSTQNLPTTATGAPTLDTNRYSVWEYYFQDAATHSTHTICDVSHPGHGIYGARVVTGVYDLGGSSGGGSGSGGNDEGGRLDDSGGLHGGC